MDVPGYVGFQVIGDKAMEFYMDMPNFINKNIEDHKSRVFASRFLTKPTVFMASNSAIREMLTSENEDIRLGYKDYFESLFGDIILFSDGLRAQKLRNSFMLIMDDCCQKTVLNDLKRDIENSFKGNKESMQNNVYSYMKELMTKVSLSIFFGLGFDESQNAFNDINNLIINHWHGIISIPLNVKIPLILSSSYRKAHEAKKKLTKIILSKLSESESHRSSEFLRDLVVESKLNEEEIADNVLLFVSALAPKAFASVLCSFVLSKSLWEEEFLKSDGSILDEDLECILYEIYRLWPPFIGGRRVTTKNTVVSGFNVPEGYGIIYISWAAHRDPATFEEPNSFKPERWLLRNKHDKDKLFTFGAGTRSCIGEKLILHVIKETCKMLLKTYTWNVGSDIAGIILNPSSWKWVPVARLKNVPKVQFTFKT